MALHKYILRRAGIPSGRLSWLWAWMFNKSNADENAAAVEALGLEGHERVVDIGFGGGASFPLLLKACPDGHVTSVDPVEDMGGHARSTQAGSKLARAMRPPWAVQMNRSTPR